MSKQYNICVEPISIYNKDLTWRETRDILYNFISRYRPEECLEVDIISLLIQRVDKLVDNINNILYYLNKYRVRDINTYLIELLTKGEGLYNELSYIIRKSTGKRPKSNSPDEYFIKKFIGVKGYLFDILTLIDDIELWNDNISYESNM